MAESRERELKRAQAARLAEEKEAAERRIAALKAQREADNSTLRERHSEELEKVRRDLEDRLTAGEERHESEVASLREQIEGLRARRNAESRLYGERLSDLERGKVVEKGAAEKEMERRLGKRRRRRPPRGPLAELQDALEESGHWKLSCGRRSRNRPRRTTRGGPPARRRELPTERRNG